MSPLQDALDGTDYWVALPSQEDTALHHPQSPGSSGGLLRGSLAITTTGLPPVSHQDLSRRTNDLLARLFALLGLHSLSDRNNDSLTESYLLRWVYLQK